MNNKKIEKLITILLSLVFSLVAIFAIILTIAFIKPPPQEDVNTKLEETKTPVQKDKNEELTGNTTGNLIQNYDNLYGFIVSNNKYIFKYEIINETNCLTKTDIATNEKQTILTGYKIKFLNIIKDNLYFVSEGFENGISYEIISYINIDGNNFSTINTTKSSKIESMVSDGTNIYYTISNDNYLYQVDMNGAVTKLYNSNIKGETPHIIGIYKGKIFYVNGIELCSVGIQSKINTIISTQYVSTEQYPIITDKGIYCFENLLRTKLVLIDFEGNLITTLIEDSSTQELLQSRINSINYSCGYIFLSVNDKIFYIDKKDSSIKLLKEANLKTSQIYLTDQYLIIESAQYSQPEFHNINWLLAS